jgi:aspartyl-tRNA(Asn)/glutamyl-tRNA(Gln) amidotransferase subunit B
VDFNRGGTPLVEIVTEPDLHDPATAREWLALLRTTIRQIGASDVNMEEGSLRCDANVSVRRAGETALGTKAEVKNLNSFRFLEKALDHEIERQTEIVASGARVVQETRLWDPAAGHTVSMRSKEEAHDYRYFPEPDLPPLTVDAARVERIRAEMPELPEARRRRFVERYALPEYDAAQLTQSREGSDYFEAAVAAGASPKVAGNWIINIAGSSLLIERLTGLLALVEKNVISGSIAKTVFDTMIASGRTAEEIVAAEDLAQIDDEGQIARLVAEVLAKNASAVAQYRGGKSSAFGFLVGQVMKAASGKANPKRVNELLKRALEVG